MRDAVDEALYEPMSKVFGTRARENVENLKFKVQILSSKIQLKVNIKLIQFNSVQIVS